MVTIRNPLAGPTFGEIAHAHIACASTLCSAVMLKLKSVEQSGEEPPKILKAIMSDLEKIVGDVNKMMTMKVSDVNELARILVTMNISAEVGPKGFRGPGTFSLSPEGAAHIFDKAVEAADSGNVDTWSVMDIAYLTVATHLSLATAAVGIEAAAAKENRQPSGPKPTELVDLLMDVPTFMAVALTTILKRSGTALIRYLGEAIDALPVTLTNIVPVMKDAKPAIVELLREGHGATNEEEGPRPTATN